MLVPLIHRFLWTWFFLLVCSLLRLTPINLGITVKVRKWVASYLHLPVTINCMCCTNTIAVGQLANYICTSLSTVVLNSRDQHEKHGIPLFHASQYTSQYTLSEKPTNIGYAMITLLLCKILMLGSVQEFKVAVHCIDNTYNYTSQNLNIHRIATYIAT